MSGLTLAEQIAQLDDAAPPDIDIERLDGGLLEDGGGDRNLLAGRGHYLDVGASTLRKQGDALVDPKYDGARTNRSQLYEFNEGTDDEDLDEHENDSGSESQESFQEEDNEDDEPQVEERGMSPDEETFVEDDDDERPPTNKPPEETVTDNLTETLRKTREADRDKGRAIVQQRALQQQITSCAYCPKKYNKRVPDTLQPDDLPPYVASEAGRAAAQTLLQEVLAFSDTLATFRKRLLEVNEPDVKVPPPKRQRLDSEDWEEQTRDATISATEVDAAYHPFCVRTLEKWSSKIAAVTPTLSSRSKSFRGGGAPHSTVELVEDALGESGAKGGGKAVGRTRVRRSGGTRIGTLANNDEGGETGGDGAEGDAEVFDDLDFYQTLLRDVIDSRTGADGAEDWTTRQRLKKAKKVVDTKASKGRKLRYTSLPQPTSEPAHMENHRYEVHEKLQNFMVPVPTGTWHEEQIDELFANLLGRGIGGDRPISL
ncbi:rRNA-processing protein bfr2 [Ceratobasidium sp. 428]|nr:rRNA-processing protein bfr2 [Ceratobasidium sp. 428]